MSAGDSDHQIPPGAQQQQWIWDEVHAYHKRRAVIEQAKGMLMVIFDVDADDAFEILRTISQHRNTKLAIVAEQIQKDLVELATLKRPARDLVLDHFIRVAARRVDDQN